MFSNLRYYKSKFWLVFWVIVYFPVAVVLCANGWEMTKQDGVQKMRYNGHQGWLIFWALIFVPIAALLLVLNGLVPINDQH